MAPPSATQTETQTAFQTLSLRATKPDENKQAEKTKLRWFSETGRPDSEYPYTPYLPTYDADLHLPPLEPFEHKDPGHEAVNHADPTAFLRGAEIEHLTPDFATEVTGVQLHKLDTAGRQQLALYVAQRGVVVGRLMHNIRFVLVTFRLSLLLIYIAPCRPSETRISSTRIPTGSSTIGEPSSGGLTSIQCLVRPRITPTSISSSESVTIASDVPNSEADSEYHRPMNAYSRDATKTHNYDRDTRLSTSAWHSDVSPYLSVPSSVTLSTHRKPPSRMALFLSRRSRTRSSRLA